jgi:ADP-dependent NAD(P)H-hydrate dehydratase / NAD(P)H-hydrate epimerase
MSEEARLQVKVLGGLGHPPRLLGSDGSDLRHELAGADVIIDAVFGIGLNRAIDGRLAEFIEAINASHAVRVALDVPSGIDSNNGQVLGTAVNAGITIAFAHRKLGLCQGAAVRHTGTIHVADLGIPDETILHEVGYAAQLVDDGEVVAALGGRAPDAHKYRNGNVLVVAGSSGKTGAALLTATAALRAGAGVATIATWPQAIASIETRVREVMTHRIDSANLRADLQNALHKRSAVAIGPGLGLDAAARKLIEAVVIEWSGPVVVDADAITAFAGRAAQLKAAAGPRVLTPHAGELARLVRSDSASIEKDRVQAAQEAAELTGSVIVLKGPYSIIASPEGDCYICNAVNPLLATAGSGDVLAGIIAALLHSAPTSACAAAAGVQLHASAAAAWSEQHGGAQRGMLAGDIAAMLPIAIQRFGTWPVGG